MQVLNIAVRSLGNHSDGYEAQVGESDCEEGASPDEALGAAIRALWLGGSLDGPVQINLTMDTEGGKSS